MGFALKSGLLVKTREEDRFEISAAIEILLPMHKLQALLADLQRKNGTEPDAAEIGGAKTGEAETGVDGDTSDTDEALFTHQADPDSHAGTHANSGADTHADSGASAGPGAGEDEEQQT